MAPEQLPWDFRKQDRSGPAARFVSGGGGFNGAGQHRWRGQNRHPHPLSPYPQPYRHHHNQTMKRRWFSDFRSTRPIPPGCGKQGGWHMVPEVAGHEFPPFAPRYVDRNLEKENFRPFWYNSDGRYLRNSRENKGPFTSKSMENPLTCIVNSTNCNNSEDTQACLNSAKGNNTENIQTCPNNNNKGNKSEDTQTFLNNIKGNSFDHPQRKLEWNWSQSVSSRGSAFSRSSSSKSMCVDSTDKIVEVQQQIPMHMNSSAAVYVEPNSTVPSPSNEISSRKKPRLGWGEGLAKYEKKKVDGSEDAATKDGLVSSVITTESRLQSPSVNLLDKGIKVENVLDCDSLATPSLVACDSSPGTDEKESIKAVNIDHFVTNLSCSPTIMSRTHSQEPTSNLENPDLASIANSSSLTNETVQSNDPSSANSGYVQTTTMNKLFVEKVDALKALEVTETEIDSFDAELKSLMPEPEDIIVENMPAFNEDEHETIDTILASNKESANRAMGELNKLLPAQQCYFDMLEAHNASSVQRDPLVIKERFLMRKRSLMFKEKVIALKFKVHQHFWKQGRIISVSKLRRKSRRKLDICRTGYKKNCSPSHSRISYPGRSSRKVPAKEVIKYVNALREDSPFKLCRSALNMPSLILDKDSKMSMFISNNALVEDPCAAEKGRSMLNTWTAEEKEIFIDKLSIFGKVFSKLASFLEGKTIADCVEFYYKNHKSECFQRAKTGKTKQMKPQYTNYLVTNGKRWDREANAASLDILGEASEVVGNVNDGIETHQKEPRNDHGPMERSNSLDNEAVAADVLAGICGSISSEAMSSCITSSCMKTPVVTKSVDDECSDESCEEMDSTSWNDEEKSSFVQAVSSYGNDFGMISQCLGRKSVKQCEVFFGKTRKCLGLDRVLTGACNGDVNGSDTTDDGCVVQSGEDCKIEVDHHRPETDIKSDPMICVEINSQPCSPDSVSSEPVSKNSSRMISKLWSSMKGNGNADR